MTGFYARRWEKGGFKVEELWGTTYGRFEHLASLDLHLEEIKKKQQYAGAEIRIGKAEAEHLLTLTKSLITYAAELMREVK